MPTLLRIIRRYLYSIWWHFMSDIPDELKQAVKDSNSHACDITLLTRAVSNYYVADAVTRTARTLRLVSLTAYKVPRADNFYEHEYTLLCLQDTDGAQHHIALHRGPTRTPVPNDSTPTVVAKSFFKDKLSSPATDKALLCIPPNPAHGPLSSITLSPSTPKTLLDILMIAVAVNRQLSQYRILDSNCFAHTELIMSLAEFEFGVDRTPHSTRASTNYGIHASQYNNDEHFEPAKDILLVVKEDMYGPIVAARETHAESERVKAELERQVAAHAESERVLERQVAAHAESERVLERQVAAHAESKRVLVAAHAESERAHVQSERVLERQVADLQAALAAALAAQGAAPSS
ncbi:hypothetical protein C0991_005197 [Blastosporella zonata]|nr:hypothetical protein C0991_005197 [Blastosporella zonata]